MATRKKTRKTTKKTGTRRRSSRMGFVGSKAGFNNALPLIAGLALGAVGSAASDKVLARFNFDPKISGALKVLGGLYISGNNAPLWKGIGLGIASAGTITVAHSFGLLQSMTSALNGIAGGGMYDDDMGGIRQDAYLSGVNYNAYVNGVNQNDVLADTSYSAHCGYDTNQGYQ